MQEFVNDNMAEPLETNRQTRLELARILHYILRLLQSDYIDENIIDSVQYRLDWVYNTVVRYADLHVIDELSGAYSWPRIVFKWIVVRGVRVLLWFPICLMERRVDHGYKYP